MAKRKTKNKSYAAQRAAEAAQREQQGTRQTIFYWIGGMVLSVAILVGFVLLLPFLFDASDSEEAAADIGTVLEGDRTVADLSPSERNDFYGAPPEMIIDTDKSYEAVIETNRGTMRLELFDDQAPVTVNNFVFLANEGFYDGTVFHRVISDFMAQGGDPTGTGSGGPGYRFEDEIDPTLTFDRRGLLAMANSGPATNGSQFFITFQETSWLNGNHTIFGELIEGDDVLGSINITDGTNNPPDEIVRVEIVER
ncbi:MAG: peptidylprolyl isomerase [Chloroflexota bacterium]